MKYSQRSKSRTFLQLPKLNSQSKASSISTMQMRAKKINSLGNPEKILQRVDKQKNDKEVTAKAYVVYNQELQTIKQCNYNSKREIASLTKMMTLLLSVNISKRFSLNLKSTYFRVSSVAGNVPGTSAQLQPLQWLTVQDLLHGLMLPSGNDAATVLAQNFGAFLYYERLGQKALLQNVKSLDVTEDSWNLRIYTEQFVRSMNALAKDLQMKDTTFVNPHGLDSSFRYQGHSTAHDMAILTKNLMSVQQCRMIMACKTYRSIIKITNGGGNKQIDTRHQTWSNTNKLLFSKDDGYIGCKTGQTINAGNCLSSVYRDKQGKIFFVIVLGSETKDQRFKDTQFLVQKYIKLC